MLARSKPSIPPGMAYEPKWDGFRCLTFRDNDEVQLISRNGRDLSLYFPEVIEAVLANTPPRCILDGELVLVAGDRLDFGRLSERIHPAQKRIDLLSTTTPASLVCWDLLALDQESLLELPFAERRRRLEQALTNAEPPIHLTPITYELSRAEVWFTKFEGAGLDGVIAKDPAGPYAPGQRTMIKIKHSREADVVVAGWREHKNSTPELPLLGSLQLGLHDAQGQLHFVGVAAAFTAKRRAELAEEFAPLTLGEGPSEHPWASLGEAGRPPRATSRWSTEIRQTNLIWPMPVCTVGYDHMEGHRFRHTTQFRRWRPDREPTSCSFDQLDEAVGFELAKVLDGTV